MNTVRFLDTLRHTEPEDIIRDFAADSRERFQVGHEALPVIIPTRDEEHDLPATLASLALSEQPVMSVVVCNRSQDRSADYAADMGAIVLEADHGNKMAANQVGLTYAIHELGKRTMLFTDADTLVLPTWAGTLNRQLARHDKTVDVGVFGQIVYWHGKNVAYDVGRTLYGFGRDLEKIARRQRHRVQGPNYGLSLPTDATNQAIQELDPNIFNCDDFAIRDSLLSTGGIVERCFNPQGWMIARNDRLTSIWQALQVRLLKDRDESELYNEQYGDSVRYKPLK